MKVQELFEKRPEWHDSDAPDANGKFRDLGVNDLADWLIKTRGKDMQKINGSIQQQINFNKNKNPKHAAKMRSVHAAVKRKLAEEIVHIEESQVDTALKNKSEKSNINMRTLRSVYNRGLAAWRQSHRPGTTAPQWAMARVNSFISGGKTRTTADKDLWDARK